MCFTKFQVPCSPASSVTCKLWWRNRRHGLRHSFVTAFNCHVQVYEYVMFITSIFRTCASLCDRNGIQMKGCCSLDVAFTSALSGRKRLTKLQQLNLFAAILRAVVSKLLSLSTNYYSSSNNCVTFSWRKLDTVDGKVNMSTPGRYLGVVVTYSYMHTINTSCRWYVVKWVPLITTLIMKIWAEKWEKNTGFIYMSS